jgi:hypothetical protein
MKKIFFYILLCCVFYTYTRDFFAPDDYRMLLWNSIKIPLAWYKESRGYDYHIISSGEFKQRSATQCFLENKNDISDLSALFHGSDQFLLSEVNVLPLELKNDYSINPAYSFSESTCNLYLQFNKDYKYNDDRDVRLTVSCCVPFKSQRMINGNSASMYFASNTNVKKNINQVNNRENDKKNMSINRYGYDFSGIYQGKNRFELREENGKNVFAVRCDYLLDNPNLIVEFEKNINPIKYISLNQYIPSGNYITTDNRNITQRDIFSGYCLASESTVSRSPMVCQPIVDITSDLSSLIVNNMTLPLVYNKPLPSSDFGAAALIPYLYGTTAPNEMVVVDSGVPYSLHVKPDFVRDNNYGDDIVLDNKMYYADAFSNNSLFAMSIPQNNIVRLVATGNFPLYSKTSVSFLNAPVAIQTARDLQGDFPEIFGISCPLNNHVYNVSENGPQFNSYIPGNNVAILNSDGTFSDDTCQKAVLWYKNDYSSLFNEQYRNVLSSLYMTSALDGSGNVTPESQVLYKKFDAEPSDLEARVKRLEEVTLNPGLLYPYYYYYISLVDIVEDFSNSIYGDIPIKLKGLNEDVVLLASVLGNTDTRQNVTKKINNNEYIKRFKTSESLQIYQQQMQYDQFSNDGVGDIDFQCMIGSYFYDDSVLADLIIGLQIPTSNNNSFNSGSYLAVPLGTNGHCVMKYGVQSSYEFRHKLPMKFFGSLLLEHAFSALENISPSAVGYSIFNFLPVVIPADVTWNALTASINASVYANDYSGVVLGYQYWNKDKDCINSKYNHSINFDTQKTITDLTLYPTIKVSNRSAHTFIASLFSEITNDLTFSCSYSRVISGNNTAQTSGVQMVIQLNY